MEELEVIGVTLKEDGKERNSEFGKNGFTLTNPSQAAIIYNTNESGEAKQAAGLCRVARPGMRGRLWKEQSK